MEWFFGGNGEGATPVPISNTEVKPFSADGAVPLERDGRVGRGREFLLSLFSTTHRAWMKTGFFLVDTSSTPPLPETAEAVGEQNLVHLLGADPGFFGNQRMEKSARRGGAG